MSPRARPALLAALLGLALATGGCGPAGCERPGRQAGAGRAAVPSARAEATHHDTPSAAPAPRPSLVAGEVVRVRDGDSLVVLVGREQLEVRLDGVDAPELAQAWGNQAKRCTSGLAFGRRVRLAVHGRDKYDRTLAEVSLPDGRSLNRELVSAGCAWWFRKYSDDAELERREREARSAGRGLWGGKAPEPPWEFRETSPRPPARRSAPQAR